MKPFDVNGAFRAATDCDGLRRLAVRGAGVTMLSQTLAFAIQMIATVTLARLLTPDDFGLVTIVTTFSLLLMNVGFNGFTEAVVQTEDIDHSLASNLFWINASIGSLLTVAFACSGSLMARFYGDIRVARVVMAMSATIFFTSLSVLHVALLKRAMRFSVLSTNDVLARVVSVVVSIGLCWGAFEYWALVAGAIALPLVTCIGAWARCEWIPGLPRRRSGTVEMVRFAMNTYGHFAANYCTRNFDNFLVGWIFGPQSLGLYKKAYDLSVLPVGQLSEPLNAVAVPTLSRLAGDSDRLRHYVLRALSTLAFVGMGLGATFTLVGEDVILLLLGPRWDASGRIFRFFAPGIGAMLLYLTHVWIYLSLGRADRLLRWGIFEFAVIGSLFLVGLHWGPIGIAVAWVASWWILTLPALWYAGRPAHLGIAAILGAVWRYILASALAGVMCAVIIGDIPPLVLATGWGGALARSLAASLLFGTLYLIGVVVLHRGRTPLYQVAALLQDMLPAGVPGYSRLTREPAHRNASPPVAVHTSSAT